MKEKILDLIFSDTVDKILEWTAFGLISYVFVSATLAVYFHIFI